MRAAVFEGPGNVRIEEVPDPVIELDTDAVVRVTAAAIGGSDLWAYRGYGLRAPGSRIGHEFVGVVEAVGRDVRTIRRGDFVLAPFTWSCGVCDFCRRGLTSSCVDGGWFSEPEHDGGQGEAVRVPHADGTLVVLPPGLTGAEKRVLPLCDVLSTGHHAAVSAGVNHRSIVAVIGDGAVGLCAVLAARRLGAARVISVGHHPDRLALAAQFGAAETVEGSGLEAAEEVIALTGGVDAVLECVGAQGAWDTAIAVAADGATIGYVGVPHLVERLDVSLLFGRNIAVRGGVTPARHYIPDLLADVLDGTLDASPVFDLTVDLADLPDGYAMMDDRLAVKPLVRVG
ncbi:MAG: alcohol dehydrogenase catalytic domain-containing protein [Geodermatophilaceae bacterium]|nr:alcohol dehydrogenase catalytic domain-containing protein [Geodermatophilaceae bacterium]